MKMLNYVAFEQLDGLTTLVDAEARRYSVSLRVMGCEGLPGSTELEMLYLIEPEPIHVEVFVDGQQSKEDTDFRYRDGRLYWLAEKLAQGTEVRVRCYTKKD